MNSKFEHPGLKEPGFVDSLFDLFDTDKVELCYLIIGRQLRVLSKDGKIEFDELVCGLSVLAEGNFEEKAVCKLLVALQ